VRVSERARSRTAARPLLHAEQRARSLHASEPWAYSPLSLTSETAVPKYSVPGPKE
jgi:hypothetical protein